MSQDENKVVMHGKRLLGEQFCFQVRHDNLLNHHIIIDRGVDQQFAPSRRRHIDVHSAIDAVSFDQPVLSLVQIVVIERGRGQTNL